MDTDSEFLTRTETATFLRCSVQTLRNLAAMRPRQGPPFLKTGRLSGKALYRKSDVVAWLESHGVGGESATPTRSKRKPDPPGVDNSSPAKRGPRRRAKAGKG